MVDQDKIKQTLDKYFAYTGKVTIDVHTGAVSCTGSVKWQSTIPAKISRLPVNFGKIRNDFDVSWGELTTLEGSPVWVGRDFRCYNNQITSLAHAPSHVGESFYCSNNQLTSLEHAPSSVGGDFLCAFNQLTSLVHCPAQVDALFCMNNKLTSFEGAPTVVDGELRCWGNNFQSLDGLPEQVRGRMWMDTPDADLPLLRLLAIKGVTTFLLGIATNDLQDILNRHVGKGRKGAIPAAKEIMQAGEQVQREQRLDHNPFERNARW